MATAQYPTHHNGAFDTLRYLLDKEGTKRSNVNISSGPNPVVEIVHNKMVVVFDHLELIVGVAPGRVIESDPNVDYGFRRRSAEEILERGIAMHVAPKHGLDYLDDVVALGSYGGVFTIKEFGSNGNNHNFHDDIITPPDQKMDILDRFYSAVLEYLGIITSEGFQEAVMNLEPTLKEIARFEGELLVHR